MKAQYWTSTMLAISILSACGGGSGGGSLAGIGGTGITSTGTIDSFGSIFVNGVRYDTDSADITIDSNSANASDLRLGMVVTVSGTTTGNTGTASSVIFDDDLQGPIAAISANADNSVKTLTILGLSVEADRLSTVFDDITFDTLAVNDVVEVSGFTRSDGVIQATRIEGQGAFQAGISEIEIEGQVSNLFGTTFQLAGFTVNAAGADLSDLQPAPLSNGLNIEVRGTLMSTTIIANRIELEDGPFDDDEGNVELEGIITDFVDNGNFRVFGQLVDASNAQLQPANLVLQNDLMIEVEGSVVNGVLIANEVEARDGEIELEATIQALDLSSTGGTITLAFATGNLSLTVNSQTELDDETDTFDPITFTNLRVGDFIEVEALQNDGDLIATELQLANADDQRLQGPVDSFITNTSITILGLSYSTVGANFEDINDTSINATTFFNQLSVGDVVEITDNTPANGIADEVEFED